MSGNEFGLTISYTVTAGPGQAATFALQYDAASGVPSLTDTFADNGTTTGTTFIESFLGGYFFSGTPRIISE
jgi:hypothetical protein